MYEGIIKVALQPQSFLSSALMEATDHALPLRKYVIISQ
jgi:hypothetical protein